MNDIGCYLYTTMPDSVNCDFINYCNVRKEVLLVQNPNASADEIVALLVNEFNSLTPLPPSPVKRSAILTNTKIDRPFVPTTISTILFPSKN